MPKPIAQYKDKEKQEGGGILKGKKITSEAIFVYLNEGVD